MAWIRTCGISQSTTWHVEYRYVQASEAHDFVHARLLQDVPATRWEERVH